MLERNELEEKTFDVETQQIHEIEMDYFWNGIFIGLLMGAIIFAVIFNICQSLSS